MNKLKMTALATVLTLGSTWAFAQDAASDSSSMQNTNQSNDDRGTDWGWVGLLGLAGLIGLKRKERDEVVRTANRPI